MLPRHALIVVPLLTRINRGNKSIASRGFCDGFETDVCAGSGRVTSYNFERVVESVGAGVVVGLRVLDVIILAAVKQEADLETVGVEIGAGYVALIVYDAGNCTGGARIGVADFLKGLSVVDEAFVATS